MTRGVLATLVAIMGLLTGCGLLDSELTAEELTTFEGPGFTIDLPGKPVKQVETVKTAAGPIQLQMFSVEDGGDGVFVGLNDIPKGFPLSLDGAAEGAVQSAGGTLQRNVPIKWKGHEAREVRGVGTSQGTDFTMFARIIKVGNQLFQVMYIIDETGLDEVPDVYTRVANSLEFTG